MFTWWFGFTTHLDGKLTSFFNSHSQPSAARCPGGGGPSILQLSLDPNGSSLPFGCPLRSPKGSIRSHKCRIRILISLRSRSSKLGGITRRSCSVVVSMSRRKRGGPGSSPGSSQMFFHFEFSTSGGHFLFLAFLMRLDKSKLN